MYQHATSVGLTFCSNQLSTSTFEVPLRNYRRNMKPRLPRKITAQSRINLNRFWNELEEFYNRYDDRKTKNNNNPLIFQASTSTFNLPPYTTDTFDHERETAENLLNERLEFSPIDKNIDNLGGTNCCDCCCSYRFDSTFTENDTSNQRDRIHSCGVESDSSSVGYQFESDLDSESDSDEDVFFGTSNNGPLHYLNTMTLPSTPRPPKTLLDLIHGMVLKEF